MMTTATFTPLIAERIDTLLAEFKLPALQAELVARFKQASLQSSLPLLLELLELEADGRLQRRIERLLKASKLPPGKTFETFLDERIPSRLAQTLRDLSTGDFLDRADNVLVFGLPGTGKSHAACALGHALARAGRSVLFTPTFQLVQELLAAKRDFLLPNALRRLDAFELLILDDIGYVQQSPEEVEVLFTLMAERYERRSMLITSNLVFSDWEKIFKNPMTTAAAIDRLVHHSVILEFDVPSFRTENAKKRTEMKEENNDNYEPRPRKTRTTTTKAVNRDDEQPGGDRQI
jgi:DNA replication protein DnaC